MAISKDQTTMLNRYKELALSLRDFYRHQAILAELACDEFTKQKMKLINDNSLYAGLNQYYRGKLDGMDEILWDNFYDSQVEFGYLVDGVFYSTTKFNGTSKIPDEIHRKIVDDKIQGFTRYKKTGKQF